MPNTDHSPTPADVLQLLKNYPARWLVPAAGAAVLAAVFTLVWTRPWVATQGLIVRNAATDTQRESPGGFRSDNDLKVTLETILEIAHSRGVLKAALLEVGPPDDYEAKPRKAFPTADDIDELSEAVKLTAPKGVEFGTTEVVYLRVTDRDRIRAIALASALYDRLDERLRDIREQQAESMTAELADTVAIAERDLAAASDKLTVIEAKAGSDLVELRILHRSASDTSDLRRNLLNVTGELRRNEIKRRDAVQLRKLLQRGAAHPQDLLAVPNDLLVSQPALKQLKEGLIAAQLKSSSLQGRFTDAHPRVKAARNSVASIEQQMRDEIGVAMRGVETELRMADSRDELLRKQRDGMQARLDKLVALRVDYSSLIAEVEHRTLLVEQARTRLMDVRADRAGATSGSLLSRIDAPSTGTNPAGPGHLLVILASLIGGLIIGVGLLVLTVPPAQPVPIATSDRRANGAHSESYLPNGQHVPSLVES